MPVRRIFFVDEKQFLSMLCLCGCLLGPADEKVKRGGGEGQDLKADTRRADTSARRGVTHNYANAITFILKNFTEGTEERSMRR